MDNLRLILILIGLVILGLIWFFHQPRGSRKPGAVRRDQPRAEPGLRKRTVRAKQDRAMEEDDVIGDPVFETPEQTTLPSMHDHPDDAVADEPVGPDGRREPVWNEPEVLRDTGDEAGLETSDRVESDFDTPAEPDVWPQDRAKETDYLADDSADGHAPNVVTLYVRAREGRRISGVSLLDAAIKAGLRFGDMNIFHRMHRGSEDPVFSMANLTSPGSFDPANWNLFETQGVTLFMMLPGPLSALDAWDAMLATGQRLSELLEADLLDDAQCKVTRQRLSQLREEMREFDRKHDWH